MPNYKKPQGKNFVPRDRDQGARPGRAKAGSRSPGHRGYRPADENAPRKQRWDADQRAARATDRSSDGRGARSAPAAGSRDGSRPADRYSDRNQSADRRRPAPEGRGYRADEGRGYRAGEGRGYRAAEGRGNRSGEGRNNRADDSRGRRTGDDRAARSDDSRGYRQGGDTRGYRQGGDGRGYRSADDSRGFRSGEGRGRGSDDSRGYRADDSRGRRTDDSRGYRPDDARGRRTDDARGNRSDDSRDRRSEDSRGYRSNDGRGRGSDDTRGQRSGDSRGYRADDSRGRRSGADEGYRRPSSGGDRPFRDDFRPSREPSRDDRGHGRSDGRSFQDPDRRPERRSGRDSAESSFYPSRSDHEGGHHFTPQDDTVLERLEAQATLAEDVEGVTFGDLGLGANIVRELAELGAASPFPIQAATIPDVIAGRDVLGRGRTGSGKTIAFGAPLVEKLMENGGGRKRSPGRLPRALIVAPTRELALQIDRTVQPIARAVGLFTTQIYGGVPQARQVVALQRGVDIVIGTPGRLEDLIEQGRLDLSEVVVTVLDEADHMCDLGFLEPVQRLLRLTAPKGQKLLFSATLDSGVAKLVDEFLRNPAVHEVAGEDQASSTIDHRVFVVEHRDKTAVIEELASREGKTLIFSRTRAYAEQLSDMLEDAGIRSTSLHGDLNQSRRTRNLGLLTSGRVSVLVATDVAARGIHVDDIDLVIQADAPDEYKTYLHRSGRTGRAGKQGTVVTLIPKQRRRRMDDLLSRAEITAEFTSVIPGDEAVGAI